MARAAAGDRRAFERLVEPYRVGLRRAIARAVVAGEDRDDIEQETLIEAWRALPKLREPDKFPGWLFGIARHCALRHRQRSHPIFLPLHHAEHLAAPLPNAQEQDVIKALRQLPTEISRAATLHYLEGWPVARIAKHVSATESTVKWRLYEARRRLRQFWNHGENH